MRNPHHLRTFARHGFSLVEMLVAIGIMALAISALVVSIGAVGGAGRRASTATTLRKLDSLVQERFEELRANFKEQEDKKLRAAMTTLPDRQRNWITILSAAEASGLPAYLSTIPLSARVVVMKFDRYRGTFPQREEDLFGPDGNESTAADNSPLLVQWRTFNPSTKTDRTLESSELLNLALTYGVSAGRGREVVDSLKKSHVQDKDGNGLAELYDDWGNPLRFYNAPTRLVRPGGVGTLPSPTEHAAANQLMTGIPAQAASATDFTSAFNQDPFDAKGALRTLSTPAGAPNWYVAPALMEANYHTVDTYYRPLIVSCGEDGSLGMGEPAPVMPLASGTQIYDRLGRILDPETASDNITSLQAVGAQ